jgi:hypothetical protein
VWLRSTCRRVKSPLPLHSGLRLRVHREWHIEPDFAPWRVEDARTSTLGASTGSLRRAGLPAEAAEQRRLVAPRGFDPRFPAHRAGALATRRRGIF